MFKAIIFDMDGVLVKSEGAIAESFNRVLEKYGTKLNPADKQKHLGRSLRDRLEVIKKENSNIPKNLSVQEFSQEAFQYQLEILKDKLVPDPIIINLMKSFKKNNIKIGVATSSLKYRAKILLEAIGVFNNLDAFVASDDVINHKPHPDIFLEASTRLDILPENCVVIEDAKNGIDAAQKANMKTIGLITNNHSAEELQHADLVINNLAELNIEKIRRLF